MGATYEEIDSILYGVFDLGLSLDDVEIEAHVDDARIKMIMDRVRSSEHKRSMPAIVSLDEALAFQP